MTETRGPICPRPRPGLKYDPYYAVRRNVMSIKRSDCTTFQPEGCHHHGFYYNATNPEATPRVPWRGHRTMDPPIKKCKRTPEAPAARLHLEEATGSKGKEPLTPLPNEPTNTGMTITKTSQVTTADDMTIDILDSSTPPTPIIPMPTTEAPTRRRAPRKSGHQRQFAKTHGAWRTPKPSDARAPDPT